MKRKFGIIGIGVMGQAILSSIVGKCVLHTEEIALYDVLQEKLQPYSLQGYKVCSTPQELIDSTEYVLIAIKPQHFDSFADSIIANENNVFISIMAGKTLNTIATKISGSNAIARVMPNTPCQIGKGICAVCYKNCSLDNEKFVSTILATCGETIKIDEEYFDAVTSVSGSGPAYVYMFLNGMINGGINGGLSYEQSKKLAINTLIGASMLAKQSTESLSTLVDKVCSKGGTTIEAVNVYREGKLEELIGQGIDACRKRSAELSKG